jgi:anaerobic magnesium-protoporphyrin IX monomethyl ester cyclase
MMRVLLVAPGEFRERSQEFFDLYSSIKKLRVLPSLGLCNLSAVLKREGFGARIVDAYAENLSKTAFLDRVRQFRPDVVGVTSTTPFFDMAARTCNALRSAFPELPVVLGGPQVTVMKRETMLLDSVDYGVIGEGEQTFLELLRALQDGSPLDDVPNILFRRDGEIVMTEVVDRRLEVNELPMPDRSDLPLDRYYDAMSLHRRAMSMMTARGCPYRCLFCEEDVRGGRYRKRADNLVLEEMRHIVNDLGFREIVIYDDTFTADMKRTARLCEGILSSGLDFAWDCRTRVDRVDRELLRLMKRAGCHRISFGVEAAAERVREILRKGITDEQIRSAFRWSREVGIRTIGYFMIGTPGETRDEVLQTIEYAKEINPDIAHFCITVPYPGTDLYRLGVSEGYVPADYWERYIRGGGIRKEDVPYFTSKEYNRQDLDNLLKRAYREFYFRPTYVMQRLAGIRSPRDLYWHAKLMKELVALAV